MAAKTVATLADIREASDLAEREVEIPEWGSYVRVRALTRGELVRMVEGDPDAEVVNARAIAAAMLEPKVTEEEAAEILEKKSMSATKRITDAIMELSGISDGFPASP